MSDTDPENWRESLTREMRDASIQKMVDVFKSMAKHSHLDDATLLNLCKGYEEGTVYKKATSIADYEQRIKTKMEKVRNEQSSNHSNHSNHSKHSGSLQGASNLSTALDWRLESQKLNLIKKSGLFKRDADPRRFQRVFSDQIQQFANSILFHTSKYAAKPGRALANAEFEGSARILPHVLVTRQLPARPCILLDVKTTCLGKQQNVLFFCIYSDGKSSSSSKPLVFDVDTGNGFEKSASILSKLSILHIGHVLDLHPHVASMLHSLDKNFEELNARKYIKSASEIPSTYDSAHILLLPRNEAVIDAEFFELLSNKNLDVDSCSQMDSKLMDHIKNYKSSLSGSESRSNFYASLQLYVQSSISLNHVSTNLGISLVESICKGKEAKKQASAGASSSSSAHEKRKYVSKDSDCEDEVPVILNPKKPHSSHSSLQSAGSTSNQAVCSTSTSGTNRTNVKKRPARSDDVMYTDHESDSDMKSDSDDSDVDTDQKVVKRRRGHEVDDEDLTSTSDATMKAHERVSDDENDSDKSSEEEDEEELDEDDECEDDQGEQCDADEEDEEEEEVEAASICGDENAEDALQPSHKKTEKSVPIPGTARVPNSFNSSNGKQKMVSPLDKKSADADSDSAHCRRVKQAIAVAESNIHLGFESCVKAVERAGHKHQLREVRDWIVLHLESKLPQPQKPPQPAQPPVQVQQAHLTKIFAGFERQKMALAGNQVKAALSNDERHVAFVKQISASHLHLKDLSESSTDEKKTLAIRALYSALRQTNGIVSDLVAVVEQLKKKPQQHNRMLALDTSSPLSTTKSIDEFLDVNSTAILEIVPALSEMQKTFAHTTNMFNDVMGIVNAQKTEMTKVMEHLCSSRKEE